LVCNYLPYLPSIEEKKSRWLCGVYDEEEYVKLTNCAEERLSERETVLYTWTQRGNLVNASVKQYMNRMSVLAT
jgi:hypothetical protein